METLETGGFKKEILVKPRVVPSLYWCFTWNNYPENGMETLVELFEKCEIEYTIGEEVGEMGTPHLQGYIKSKTKIRPIEKFKIKEIHWEKCKGNQEQNVKYCTKSGKYVTNIRVIKDPIAINGAYDWQKEVLEICNSEPDERKIYWYWDKKGNKGKTSLAKHIYLKYGKKMIYVNGKSADVKCAIAQSDTKPEIVIFGIPRTCEDYVSYSALEEVKDGFFFSGKYESGMVAYPTPHVFVFANFPPKLESLSDDRWNVTNLGQDDEEDTESTTDKFELD